MTSQGHNGGPPSVALTPKAKIECIRGILERGDLTSIQKCAGVGIVVNADKEWVSEVTTAELQRMSSAKDRETVFRATKKLDDVGVVSKASSRGQVGRYNVIPPRIVEAVIEAFDELQSSRAKPDGVSGPVPTGNPVGFQPTSQAKPVGSEPTSQVEADQPSPEPTRAQMESLRDSYSVESEIKSPLSPQPAEAEREGEIENIGFGVVVNCETIKHPLFEINLKGVHMQLCGTVPMERIKSVAAGHALQWATELAAGKKPRDVLPDRGIANFIRGSIQNQDNKAAESEVRKKRSSSANGSSKRMSLDEISANVDAVFDRQVAPKSKPARLTYER